MGNTGKLLDITSQFIHSISDINKSLGNLNGILLSVSLKMDKLVDDEEMQRLFDNIESDINNIKSNGNTIIHKIDEIAKRFNNFDNIVKSNTDYEIAKITQTETTKRETSKTKWTIISTIIVSILAGMFAIWQIYIVNDVKDNKIRIESKPNESKSKR
jgi:hypothetical protein